MNEPTNEEIERNEIEPSASDRDDHVHGPDCDHDHHHPVQQPVRRHAAKIGRNDPCSCGSGKKYKKCCG